MKYKIKDITCLLWYENPFGDGCIIKNHFGKILLLNQYKSAVYFKNIYSAVRHARKSLGNDEYRNRYRKAVKA